MPRDPDFIARIQTLVASAGGQSRLARSTGLSLGAIQRYLSGGEPTRTALLRLASGAGVSVDWLVHGTEHPPESSPPPNPDSGRGGLALYGFSDSAQQGWYTEIAYRITTTLDWPDPECFAVAVMDDSLAADGLRTGRICIVSPNTPPRAGECVFVRKKEGIAALRRFIHEDSTWYTLEGGISPQDGAPPVPLTETLRRDCVTCLAPVIFVRLRP